MTNAKPTLTTASRPCTARSWPPAAQRRVASVPVLEDLEEADAETNSTTVTKCSRTATLLALKFIVDSVLPPVELVENVRRPPEMEESLAAETEAPMVCAGTP
ncbi:hypothetical protein L596_017169 [Steinernema carpocapsae]|uniref:Uncharacterized protein n=1 Tax=Steinernema carpocapsae TaxID=34508 RepID=A0A4U5N112_STECR|nr:hypothetical protein L596_017169 [Steinernema carpocapsae]